MKDIIASFIELLSSKKFQTAVITTIAGGICAKLKFDPEVVKNILWAGLALIGAQGAADLGKSAAKLKNGHVVPAAAPAPPVAPVVDAPAAAPAAPVS